MAGSMIIAGREISLTTWLEFSQNVEIISGSTVHRMANGAGVMVGGWRKHRFTLSGSGWTPAPLIGINYNAPIEVTLPLPFSFVANEPMPAGWSIVSESDVPDAKGVILRSIFIRVTVLTSGPRMGHDSSNNPSWELVLEEF